MTPPNTPKSEGERRNRIVATKREGHIDVEFVDPPKSEGRFMAALREFHSHPNSILDDKTNGIPLRRTLLAEEYDELVEAMEEGDLHHIAREMADVLYVLCGTALVYEIDLDAAFEEVHRAAMDKMRAGLRRADGKILKPPGFRPPDMTAAVGGRPQGQGD